MLHPVRVHRLHHLRQQRRRSIRVHVYMPHRKNPLSILRGIGFLGAWIEPGFGLHGDRMRSPIDSSASTFTRIQEPASNAKTFKFHLLDLLSYGNWNLSPLIPPPAFASRSCGRTMPLQALRPVPTLLLQHLLLSMKRLDGAPQVSSLASWNYLNPKQLASPAIIVARFVFHS